MNDDPRDRKDRKRTLAFAFPSVLALVFLAFHLPYLPSSLEDLDSINFAMGIRDFDVAHHQPHPPGYPVFILIAKAMHAVVPSEVTVLALMSVLAGALGVVAIAALYRRLDGADTRAWWSAAAVALAMTSPLYWFTAARPLSDASGLAAALAVQAMTLGATSATGLTIAAFCAGVAAGLRSQVVWLTVPLVLYKALHRGGRGGHGGSHTTPNDSYSVSPVSSVVASLAAFLAGTLLWFLPLVILSGGLAAYWHALFDQGAADLGNIQMLWTMHRLRDVREAMYFAFVAPWATWTVAAIGLACAALGAFRLVRQRSHALVTLTVAFGPYLVFDLLFQETFTSRYALPLVVPMAYLAVGGLRLLPWDMGLAVAVAVAMFDAHVGGTSVAAYARAKAPVFRLLDDMRAAASSAAPSPVLAMDRREASDMRGPRKFLGDAMPRVTAALPSPPQHEWLEAVKYWNGGGRAPVWFVVDPRRASMDLVQHGAPMRYRRDLSYPVLMSGVRPSDMDWYRVDRPDWYVGEGWSLTPEAAGVAESDARGLAHAPIAAWISRGTLGGWLMIGGRSFDSAVRPRLSVSVGGRSILDESLLPGGFLLMAPLPADLPDLADGRDYAAVTVNATPRVNVAIEQFDASLTRAVLGLGEGWHEQEYDPATGRRWRWLSEHGALRLRMPLTRISFDRIEAPGLVLHIDGESPLSYFSHGSLLTIRSGTRVLAQRLLNADFTLDVPVTTAGLSDDPEITLETDQVFSPADSAWRRSADRRHLGLRIFTCELRTGS